MKKDTEEIECIFEWAKSRRNNSGAINFKEPLYDPVINKVINRIDRKKLRLFRENNMKISLLCPSRGRASNIIKLLDNIYNNTNNACLIETLLKIDNDDKISIETLESFKNIFYIRKFIDEKTDKLNEDYYNYLASKAYGQYIWAIGDDVKIHTKNFDLILEEKIESYLKDKSDRIVYISVTEKGSKAKHPCFPIITKEAFNVLGMYFHPQLLSWGADRCIYELYSGIDRILHIPEIEIEHISYHDNKAPYDKTAQSMKERFFRNKNCHNEVSSNIIPNQIKELQKYIKEYNIKE